MRVEKNLVPVGLSSTTIRTIGLGEVDLLELWAKSLPSKVWGDNVPKILEELMATEFRVCAYVPDCPTPVAFASINPNGSPDGVDTGQLWFDHLRVLEEYQGRHLVGCLYERQLAYALTYENRRILRAPAQEDVVRFSVKRGWKHARPAKDCPFGVYHLPRPNNHPFY